MESKNISNNVSDNTNQSLFEKINKFINSSIRTRIILNFGAIVVVTVFVLELFFAFMIENYYLGGVEQILKDRVTVSADFMNSYVSYSGVDEKSRFLFDDFITESDSKFFIQVLNDKGNMIKDSYGFSDFQTIDTPDVKAALDKKMIVYTGVTESTGERIMAISKPLMKYSVVDGVVRYSISLEKVYDSIGQYIATALALGVIVIVFFLAMATVISKSIVSPIKNLIGTATEMAEGDFHVRAEKQNSDEVGQLADKINYMAQEIVKTDNIKKDFISSISHELRTPLTSIKGWGETLLLGGVEKGSIEEIGLNIINAEADRLSGIVEELLDFSRLESRTMKTHKTKVYPRRILKAVYNQFLPRGKEHNISFTLEGEEVPVLGDGNRIKQVFINILANAIKFTPPGGSIELIGVGSDDKVEITIRDTGIGISQEDLTRVREKFYKANLTSAGSGLGLSIVDEILKLHDAKMTIESEPDHGTTVKIVFPAIKEEEE
ncbi:MAG: ATP-binding protein [Filifactoraceae bacterium]